MIAPSNLEDLPPELFSLIASHLPLHATPPSLLSLALANRQLSTIVLPLINWCIILKCEKDALIMIQRFLTDTALLGRCVRELHIICDLSSESRIAENSVNVLTGLQDVINAGLLPSLHSLGITLLGGWYRDENQNSTYQYVKLRPGFFANLQSKCPRLTGLVLKNIGDTEEDRWLDESGLHDMKGLSSLTLTFVSFESDSRAHKNLPSLSGTLRTLYISKKSLGFRASQIFSLSFPLLRSLTLDRHLKDNNTEKAMEFWNRHPSLEFISCTTRGLDLRFFGRNFSDNFLPNLQHLKADFLEVLTLAPILHRLVSLAVLNSVNAQVPYLLRAVLREGLPNLKSLLINQRPASFSQHPHVEGTSWYETEDGQFGENMKLKTVTVFDGYMHSIVRGAPNLEELGIQGFLNLNRFTALSHFETMAPSLGQLKYLQRIYLSGPLPGLSNVATLSDRDTVLLQGSRILAEACKNLRIVTDHSTLSLPFSNARIRRSNSGEVEDIVIGKGFGMHIGNEDIAFPV